MSKFLSLLINKSTYEFLISFIFSICAERATTSSIISSSSTDRPRTGAVPIIGAYLLTLARPAIVE